MTELSFSSARTAEDVEEAFCLALNIFSENSASTDYRDLKTALWREDPSFEPGNLLLARDDSKRLVGMVRIVPRLLYRVDQQFTVAGVSSVCIDPEFRGKGFSSPLMKYALEQSCARGFDLALLFARRAADHYYTRFGFWGISSYNKVAISFPDATSGTQSAVALLPADPKHIDVYAKAHAACYRDSFGYIERTTQYWKFLLKKASFLAEPRWFTITVGGVPNGYAVASQQMVHEIAWLGDLPTREITAAALTKLQDRGDAGLLVAELPPRHRLLVAAEDMDITLSFRECRYGGHMVRILNTTRACELMAARITGRLDRLGVRVYAGKSSDISVHLDKNGCRVSLPEHDQRAPSYQQTCRLLGASALSLPHWEIDQPLPFNITNPDQL